MRENKRYLAYVSRVSRGHESATRCASRCDSIFDYIIINHILSRKRVAGMEWFKRGVMRLVELPGQQAEDLLNRTRSIPNVMVVGGDAVTAARPKIDAPPSFEDVDVEARAPAFPKKVEMTDASAQDETPHEVVFTQNMDDWRRVVTRRHATIRCLGGPSRTPRDYLCAAYPNGIGMEFVDAWGEFARLDAAVVEFLEAARVWSEDIPVFPSGRVGDRIYIPWECVVKEAHSAWGRAHLVAATHTGKMEFLATLADRAGVFRMWMMVVIKEFHFEARYVPDASEYRCGYFELYYTASTLAALTPAMATVRMLASPVRAVSPAAPSIGILNRLVDSVMRDANRRVMTYDWDNSAERSVSDIATHRDIIEQHEWFEVMAETLDVATVYESDRVAARRRYLMWYQTPRSDSREAVPVLPVHKVVIPENSEYLDMHVSVQLHSLFAEHVLETCMGANYPNQFDGVRPLCDGTNCGLSLRIPVRSRRFTIEKDGDVCAMEIAPTAIRDVCYQYFADAHVSFSYNVFPSLVSGSKVVQIFDLRFHCEERVLALQLGLMLFDRLPHTECPEDVRAAIAARAELFINLGGVGV